MEQWRRSASRAEAVDMLVRLLRSMGQHAPRAPRNSPGPGPSGSAPQHLAAAGWRAKERSHFAAYTMDMVSTHDTGTRDFGDFEEEAASATGPPCTEGRSTTLMVRNIPETCTTEMLLEAWPADGTWDFLYLPMSQGGKFSLGYVFINFVSEEHATAFVERWQAEHLPQLATGRRMKVLLADLQGFQANVDMLKRKPAGKMRSRGCAPVIIRNGRRLDLSEV